MAKELEHIGSVTNVGDLPQKMEQAEEAKKDVETSILERVINKIFLKNKFLYYCCFSEWTVARNFRGMGTMREENQRCSCMD